eukprot:TRINITY_DN16158_c0_g1_i1.p1 TRINITY_DN16158_c0_g1~~TRINITY_DN16158_c0_g1_i1.p1  ORF type:complete len:104 (-),score=20.30 TRINITY_DN16158_c0_g1_i1:108-419(-)
MIRSGCTPLCLISAKTSKAFSVWLPFFTSTNEGIVCDHIRLQSALLHVCEDFSPLCLISAKTSKAFSVWLPFSQALMRALYVITSGCNPLCFISAKTSKAFSV